MKTLKGKHIKLISKIVSAMDMKAKDIYRQGATQEEVGVALIIFLMSNIHKAEKELDALFLSLIEKSFDELTMVEIKEVFTQLVKNEAFIGFF